MAKGKSKRKGWSTLKIRVPNVLLERFRAKIPKGRRSGFIRMCIEQIEDDIKFMELMEIRSVKEYESWRHKIKMKRLEIEEAYKKKEAFIK